MLIATNQNVEDHTNGEANSYEDISSPLLESLIGYHASREANSYEDILPLLLESLDAIRNGELSAKEAGEFLARETDFYSVFSRIKQPIVIEDVSLHVILGSQRGFVKAQNTSSEEVLKSIIPLQDIYSTVPGRSRSLAKGSSNKMSKRTVLGINFFASVFSVASFIVINTTIISVMSSFVNYLDSKRIFLLMIMLSAAINFLVIVITLIFVKWITFLQNDDYL